MKLHLICLLFLASCAQSPQSKEKINHTLKSSEISGVWKLFKSKSIKGGEIDNSKFYFETGNKYLDLKNDENWFLSSTENNSIDNNQKTILFIIKNTEPGSWNEYNRYIKTYFVSLSKSNQKESLQLISLDQSRVEVYERVE
jgi:hypothetical protein